MAGRGQNARDRRDFQGSVEGVYRKVRGRRRVAVEPNRFQNLPELVGTEDVVDFRYFFLDFASVTLAEAPGDD